MRSLFARSLMTVLTLGTLAVSHSATAQTDSNTETPVLLYGNDALGIGSLPLGGRIPSTSGYSHPTLAQGFKVGEIGYVMTTIDVGLVMPSDTITAITNGQFSLDIALFSSVEDVNGNQVPGERIVSFNPVPTNTVGGVFAPNVPRIYTFGYLDATQSNKATLEAGQSYWVIVSYVPQTTSVSNFYWQFAAETGDNIPEFETPVEKNTSGLTYVGTIGQHDFGGDWVDHGNTSSFPNSGLRFSISGYEAPVIIDGGGGGGEQTPPTLDCYALSKGFFKNNYPSGWPASVIADGGALIGNQIYTVAQLRTMLSAKTTRGNQIGQLASQLVAVHLSRALSIQTAGENYLWWDGWAPDSAEAQAAYLQSAELINASAGFDSRGRLTGCVTGVGTLISSLDGYIADNHCDDGDDDDDDDGGCHRGHGRRDATDRDRCDKKLKYEHRDNRKRHECR
jgi:hypothetical protein